MDAIRAVSFGMQDRSVRVDTDRWCLHRYVIKCHSEAWRVLRKRLACCRSLRISKTTVSGGSSFIEPSCHKLSLKLPSLTVFYHIMTSLQWQQLVRMWCGVRETFISVDSSCPSQHFYWNTAIRFLRTYLCFLRSLLIDKWTSPWRIFWPCVNTPTFDARRLIAIAHTSCALQTKVQRCDSLLVNNTCRENDGFRSFEMNHMLIACL